AAAIAAGLHFGLAAPAAPPPLRQYEIAAKGPFRSYEVSSLVALSPDGRTLAYVENDRLMLRPLASLKATVVEPVAVPRTLFWSPDSAFIGYVASDKVWKIPVTGGASIAIADLRTFSGGGAVSWCPDGNLVLATGEGGLVRLSSLGGDLQPYVPVEEGKETDLHDPICLPDNSVVFVAHLLEARPSKMVHWSQGRRTELLALAPEQDIWYPTYDPAGYILFHRRPANAGVWALPFSLATHAATGPAFVVAPDGDVPSVSNDGTLVHVLGRTTRATQLVWLDRKGNVTGKVGAPESQWPFPNLSPDGRSVAISATEGDDSDIFVYDVTRGTRTRLNASKVGYGIADWTTDGRHLVYSEGTSSGQTTKRRAADGSGEPETLGDGWAPVYSADGRYLCWAKFSADTAWDIGCLDTRETGAKPVMLAATKAIELGPRPSPDGRYLAYSSDESGNRDEIYLRRFPAGEGKWQVSTAGGNWPRWNTKGDRLYYARGDDIMEVDVTLGAEPRLGTPRLVLSRKPLGWPLLLGWPPGFDVSHDGSRFLTAQSIEEDSRSTGIIVHENWRREFAK
ncbi:MAG TPA: hypothetical protein VJV75_10170, partial [Candidatus Polarisedimenticolia bacterium]|nr:hypothetical protein [Candidatus Polarisedimenticolia bacterium]